jgi:hypothetical protein
MGVELLYGYGSLLDYADLVDRQGSQTVRE